MDENIARELANTLNDLNIFLNRGTSTSSRSSSSSFNLTEEEKKARQQYLTNFANLTKAELEQRRYEIKNAKELDEVQRQQLLTQAKLEIQRKEIAEQFKQSSLKMLGSLDNLGKAFNDISGDVTKFNSTISMVGDEALALGKTFGTAGTVIGASIKALTFLTTVSLDQANSMLKAFHELSSVGGTARLTTEEIRQLGKASGYSVANLDKFTKNFIQLGTDLVGLGNTASIGTKTFAKMTQVGNSTYEAFNRLGVSQEQVTAAQTAYVKQSILGNQVLKKSPEDLKKASLEYLDTLIKLREITGMTFEQQQASMEKAKSQENFNQYLANLTYKELEIREKLTNATGEQKNILERELKSLENQRKQKEVIGMIAASIGGEEGTALLQAISTSGEVIQTELVAKLQNLKGIDIVGVVERIHRGEEALPYFFETIAKSGKQFSQQFGDLAAQLGGPGAEIRAVFGQNIELQKMALKYVGLTNEADRQKLIEDMKRVAEEQRIRKESGKLFDEEGKVRKDAAVETQNIMLSTGRNISGTIDEMVAFINPFTGSIAGATIAVASLAGATYLAIIALRKLGVPGMLGGLGGAAGGAAGRVIGNVVKASPFAIAGTLGGAALGAAGDYVGQDTTTGKSLGVLGNAATAAGTGAMIGSVIPGIGTAAGAIAGGVLGAGYGIYDKFFGKTSNTVAPTATATPAGSSAASATVSTVAQGGQQAVNVNIVGSIPLNVNIEKVLDPLFKLTRTPRQTAGMSEFSLADVNDEITVPVKISAMSEGFENLFKSMNDNLYAIARNTVPSLGNNNSPSSAGSSSAGSSLGSSLSDAMVSVESSGNTNAVSRKGATGLMQVLPSTAMKPGFGMPDIFEFANFSGEKTVANAQSLLTNPAIGKPYGDLYMQKMLDRYNGNLEHALIAYNWGPGNADKWLKQGADKSKLPEETRNYIKKINKLLGNETKPYASGGMILGPGTSTSDSVPAFNKDTGQPIALSTGEYVLPAGVTSILGKGYLDTLISNPNSLKRQAGGIIPGADSELARKLGLIDQVLNEAGLKREGSSLNIIKDMTDGVSKSVSKESLSMIQNSLSQINEFAKKHNLSIPESTFSRSYVNSNSVTDADFGVSSEMSMPTSNDASQFKFDRTAMLKDTETFQRQQGENLGLSSSQLVDPMREALTPMLDKQDETNKNMLSVLQNMLSVLESSTSIQSNMLNYARM